MKFSISQIKVGKQLAGIIWIAAIIILVQAAIGLYELTNVNVSLKSVYEDNLIPVRDLGKVRELILEDKVAVEDAGGEVETVISGKKGSLILNTQAAIKAANTLESNSKEVTDLWNNLISASMSLEEKKLADKFTTDYDKFQNEGIKPALAALRANNYEALKKVTEKLYEIDHVLDSDMVALSNYQAASAKAEYLAAESNFGITRLLTFGGLAFAIAMLAWIGVVITRAITRPLKQTVKVFGAISSGKYDTPVEVSGSNELSQVLFSLKDTQETLSKNIAAQQEQSDNFKEQATLYEGQLAAISNSTGVIEFDMSGKVIAANDIFLKVLGYSRGEVVGQPHSIFVDSGYRNSVEYREFWEKLNRGEFQAGQYKRIGKDGKEIWIQASYNPILCKAGKPYKVVKYATDITEQKIKDNDYQTQIEAIQSSQGVIELDTEGKIIKANQVYLNMLGYAENELLGKHVSVVLDPTYAKSTDYSALWQRLLKGESITAQVKRIAKGGKEVWIQAYYNTINDLNGKPFKIVNYTTDITAEKLRNADFEGQLSAIGKIQGVVEFTLDGKIFKVNENFANVMGYSEKEIVGNHHSMFVEPAYRLSHEYKAFWDKLARGEAEIGQYKRFGKGDKTIWLQASYNPILDLNGKAIKVVKFATDITEQMAAQHALASAVEESQEIIQLAKTGDLTHRVPLEGKTGAISALCDGINALMDKMTEVVVQVKEAGETINTAAGEIASGNNDLSSRTEQQASSLEETASSMEELASTVKQNAENAKQANQLAAAASGVAVKGGEVVGNVVTTMSAINESSRKIEDIISVIDGIAFQTNILALNAAVEAARAGEQGRGFAVVAGEVRNLAQRSASAAKEIKDLITDSVAKTSEGTKLVEDAGKTMEEIVSSVQRVTDIMGEISAASSEQSAGIDQVNNAITSMDEVTQQNAALVEEAAAAAESLVEQAVNLMDTVNEFKLNDGDSHERRTSNSPMRAANHHVSTKAVSKPVSKVIGKTGTDDGDWEEF